MYHFFSDCYDVSPQIVMFKRLVAEQTNSTRAAFTNSTRAAFCRQKKMNGSRQRKANEMKGLPLIACRSNTTRPPLGTQQTDIKTNGKKKCRYIRVRHTSASFKLIRRAGSKAGPKKWAKMSCFPWNSILLMFYSVCYTMLLLWRRMRGMARRKRQTKQTLSNERGEASQNKYNELTRTGTISGMHEHNRNEKQAKQ